MSQINVHLTVANTGFDDNISVPNGTTLRQLLQKQALGAETVQVKVDRKQMALDSVLPANCRVSVAPRNMKAA